MRPANAKSIAVVAHSYGGYVSVDLALRFKDDFDRKVFAVAFTDSVHSSRGVPTRLQKIGINFVSSDKPLGEPEHNTQGDMSRVSAGHLKHEMTSFACIEALFEFIQKRYKEAHGDAKEGQSPPEIKKQKVDEL